MLLKKRIIRDIERIQVAIIWKDLNCLRHIRLDTGWKNGNIFLCFLKQYDDVTWTSYSLNPPVIPLFV